MWHRQDHVNRQYMRREEDQPQTQTFKAGVEFIRRNHAEDNWFLQIETFDPHEPFFTQRQYQDLYPELFKNRSSVLFDWPTYGPVTEEQALVDQCRGPLRIAAEHVRRPPRRHPRRNGPPRAVG